MASQSNSRVRPESRQGISAYVATILIALSVVTMSPAALAQLSVDEQHSMQFADPSSVSRFRRPPTPAPVTVASPNVEEFETMLPLDEAIRLALEYSEVVRVLTGVSASSSGRTIYDTAIATTAIDQAVGRFDPVFTANSVFRHNETPFGGTNPGDPLGSIIGDAAVGGTDLSTALQKTNRIGGMGQFRAIDNWNQRGAGLPGTGSLDNTHQPFLEVSYTQPLLAGFGRAANQAPIVIAQLQQDQSYFQFKGSLQELVRGVVTAYWGLVQARTELWAREKQVEQSEFAVRLQEASFRAGRGDAGNVSQAEVSFNNFQANLIAARANVIQREAALRNLIGLPPEDGRRLVPSTPPTRDRIEFNWDEIIETAQSRRPDLAELNLILMADQQGLVQSSNLAKPTLNAIALHRWNGLSGTALNGSTVSTSMDNHTDWTMGVSFSVPLGLRQARAQLRSRELLISRDRANIQQSIHQIEHAVATSVRSIDQNFLQYEAFRKTRNSARKNLEVQFARTVVGRITFLSVLQAITDWGNAVSSEAQSLTAYNSELANLEVQSGTILETHGVRFMQERYSSLSPWGHHFEDDCYPLDLQPTENEQRYDDSSEAAENAFDLDDYPQRDPNRKPLELPQDPVDRFQEYDPSLPPNNSENPGVDPAPLPASDVNQSQGKVRSLFRPVSFGRLFGR